MGCGRNYLMFCVEDCGAYLLAIRSAIAADPLTRWPFLKCEKPPTRWLVWIKGGFSKWEVIALDRTISALARTMCDLLAMVSINPRSWNTKKTGWSIVFFVPNAAWFHRRASCWHIHKAMVYEGRRARVVISHCSDYRSFLSNFTL